MVSTYIPNRFDGKTAVVTGGASGIGKALVTRLLAEGATVIAADISAERLTALQEECNTSRLRTVAGDIANLTTISAIMDAADGVVDALANNAGIMDNFVPTSEMRDDLWERVIRTNLTAPMMLTRAVLPGMIEHGPGAIVNTASEAGLRGSCAGSAYTASKYGIVGLTKNDAFMYGPLGVRVNAVAPGPVRTGIEAKFESELAGKRLGPVMQATVPPVAEPELLAAAISWLLSDDAADVNGVILPVDGGWSAV